MNFEFPGAKLTGVLPPLAESDRVIIGFDAPAGYVEVAISRDDAIRLANRITTYIGSQPRA